jgi:hypothetical protein
MRSRLQDLIRDAIAIIEACDDDDCAAWLNQARAELAVLKAKQQLREALAEVEGPVVVKAALKPTKKPAKVAKGNAKVLTVKLPSAPAPFGS